MSTLKNHFWDDKKPINHNPFSKKHVIASELKPIFSQMEEYLLDLKRYD